MSKKLFSILITVCMLVTCILPTYAIGNHQDIGQVSIENGNVYAHTPMSKMAEKPDFSPDPGIYESTQTVVLSSKTEGATIYYTVNGRNPDKRSNVYSGPITVSKTTTIKAYAAKAGMKDSKVETAAYVIKLPRVQKPLFSLKAGLYFSPQTLEISCVTDGATIYYTTDGTVPNKSSAVYSGPITISKNALVKAIAAKDGMLDSAMAAALYKILLPKDPWTLVWSDEFDGTALDLDKWRPEDKGDGFGNQEEQYYTPENAAVQDGKLIIKAEKAANPADYNNKSYTSAKLFSKADWKYGKFEARIKLPSGQGFWPAFWMMPSDSIYGGWAASGEIDIMEARGRVPGETSGTLHYGASWPNNKYSGAPYYFPAGQTISEFHTYTIEWEPGEFRWYVDGNLFQTQNNWSTTNGEEKYAFPAPFDQKFYLMLNLAIGGTFDGGLMPEGSMLPAQMEVDYVKVYELTGRPYKSPEEPSTPVESLPEGARQPDATGNLVMDVDYANGIKDNPEGMDAEFGDMWNFVCNAQFGGIADAAVDTLDGRNYAKIDVTNTGSQTYSVQLEQLTTLGKGRWYQYSFDAKADKNRTLITDLGGGPSAGWAKYSDVYTANLTTEVKHFEYKFQMTKASDIMARIEFNCATDTGSVWIGNVRLAQTDPPTVDYNSSKAPLSVSGNYIYNGAFDKYTIDRMAYWNVTETGAASDVSVPEGTRELTADITDGGTAADAITVDQKGVQLASGNGYKLSFKARAAESRIIKVKITGKDGTLIYLPEQEVNLSTSMQTYELLFKIDAAGDPESQLTFMLGGNNSDVYIDDVSIVRTTVDYSNVDLYPMKNGDFSKGLESWENWIGEGGAAAISAESGEAKIAVSAAGNQPWAVQFYQSGFNMVKDMEYVVAFDVRSTAVRNFEISLENSSYTRYFTKILAAEPEITHFEYTFSMPQDDLLTFKFLLGRTDDAVTDVGAHDLFIDNVVCEVKDAKFLTSVVQNGQFTYGLDPWAGWTGDGGAADISAANGEMKISVSNSGPNSWSVQTFQEGLEFENGQTYRVSFKARADVARKININIGKALTTDPWFIAYMPMKNADLTNTMQEYVYEFRMAEPTYDNGKIVFEAGNVAGGNAATNIFIDDVAVNKAVVSVEKVAAPTFTPAGGTYLSGQQVTLNCATEGAIIRYTTDGTAATEASAEYTGALTLTQTATIKAAAYKAGMTASDAAVAIYTIAASPEELGNLILNGTFDSGTDGWLTYLGDGSNATFSTDNGKLKVDFPNYDGWFTWSTQLYQTGLNLEEGKTYVLSFDISGTIEKDISLNVEKTSDYNVKYLDVATITLTQDMQRATFEFTPTAAEADAKLVFLLGSNNVPGENFVPHSIYLDNIVLKAK